jgi:hypothetical protein
MYAWPEHGLNGGIDAQFGRARPSQSDPGTQGPRDPTQKSACANANTYCPLCTLCAVQHSTAQYSTVCPVPFVPRHTF